MDLTAAGVRRRRIEIAAFAATAVATALIAYWNAFSTFQPYDDEGSHLESVRAFLAHGSLYTDVYAYHGPFHFELMALLYRFSESAATSDGARFLVIAIWILTALAVGLSIRRLTSSWTLGVAAQIVWFLSARTLVNEPGHPVMTITLVLGAITCVLALRPPAQPRVTLAWLGVATGLLVLTKVNVGGLMLIGVAYAAALTLPPLRPFRRVAPVAAAAVPLVLMAGDLKTPRWRDWTIVAVAAVLAVGTAAWVETEGEDENDDIGAEARSALRSFVAAAAATGVVVLGILLVTGSTLPDVLYDAFIRPAGHNDVFNLPPSISDGVMSWSVVAVFGALAAARAVRSRSLSSRWSGLIRISAGLLIWLGAAEVPGLWFGGQSEELVMPALLAWVVALPLCATPNNPWDRFARVLVAALAVFQTLHIYPVVGSQRGPATLLLVLVGALCLHDGLRELGPDMRRTRELLGGAAGAVLAVSLLFPTLISSATTYSDGVALSLPGATRIHLQEPTAKMYERVVAMLKRGCDAFVSEPGYYSLHAWSGIPPVDNLIINEWMPLLSSKEQGQIVKDLLAHKRPCAIRNQAGIEFWQQGRPVKQRPLVRAIDAMETIATVGGYELRVPPERAASARRSLGSLLTNTAKAGPQG